MDGLLFLTKYGEAFDACKYLDRFFTLRITLPPANFSLFFDNFTEDRYLILNKISKRMIELYHMELREISCYFYQLKIATSKFIKNGQRFYDTDYNIVISLIVPIVIALKIVDIDLHKEFIDGNNSNPLINVFKNWKTGKPIISSFLNQNETFINENGKNSYNN